MKQENNPGISFFQRYLTLWVAICMVLGVLIGKYLPGIPTFLNRFEYARVSIPMAILIWLMIYPMMMKVDFQSIQNVGKNPKGLFVTWITNWLIKPFSMYAIASLFFFVVFKAFITPELATQYAPEQLPVAGRINALKDMGFGLAAIAEILPCYEDRDALQRHLRCKQAELQALSEKTEYRLRLLETAQRRLRKEQKAMNCDVTIKTFPQRYAATVRMVIPSYWQEGMLWNILMEETAPLNVIDGDPCYCCAVFHDKEYREAEVDVEVQKDVKGTYPDTEHIRFRVLPEVTVACATCKGSYEQMDEINAAIAGWVSDNGYTFDGPMFNIYHVSPHETANPDEYVTEVCYPVRKA